MFKKAKWFKAGNLKFIGAKLIPDKAVSIQRESKILEVAVCKSSATHNENKMWYNHYLEDRQQIPYLNNTAVTTYLEFVNEVDTKRKDS